jgi:hypothetical protein
MRLEVGTELSTLGNQEEIIEDPSSKLEGMFCLTAVLRSERKESCHFMIRSLTPQRLD